VGVVAAAVALAGALLAGCSSSKSSAPSGVLRVIGFGNNPSFVDNFNIASPSVFSLANMMYEPLVYLDDNHMTIRPYLAQSWEWSSDAKTLTMHLRQDVKWSDGQPFTSADVQYRFVTLPKKYPNLPFSVPTFQSLDTPDAHTVVFHFAEPSRTTFGPWSWTGAFIVPEHIWANEDVSKWTNPKPVTTGPFVVDKFAPQQITLKVRDDWWGGKSHGVKYVKVLPAGTSDAAQAMMLKGDADWANIGWPGVQQQWVKAGSGHRAWQATNAFAKVTFNFTKAVFDDLHVRSALWDATDSSRVVQVMNTGASVPNVTSMDPTVFGDQVAPELRTTTQQQNVAQARSELQQSGYTVSGGALVKDGHRYPLTLTTNQNYVSDARVVAAQWKQALGLNVTVNQVSDSSYSDALTKGQFDLIMWQGGGCNTFCNFSYLNSATSAAVGQVASGDMSRLHDPVMDDLLDRLGAATSNSQIQQLSWDVQRRFFAQKYYIPLDAGGASAIVNTKQWNFPAPYQGNAFPGLGLYTEPAVVIMGLTPAK
jgi:peptide/nickel transport system substrate-binding protein